MQHFIDAVSLNPDNFVSEVCLLIRMDKHLFVQVITAIRIEFLQHVRQLIVLAYGQVCATNQ